MQNKVVRFGPTALTTSAANIVNPPTVSGGTGVATAATATYVLIKHIRIVNTSSSPATFQLFLGATAGSSTATSILGNGTSVPGNSQVEFNLGNGLRLDTADFLSGLASVASNTLIFEAEGEIGIA